MRHLFAVAMVVASLSPAVKADAHAFLNKSIPAVGGTVTPSPAEVEIWFTENVEPAFSTIQVLDAAGSRVDKGNTHIDPKDGALLHVSLNALRPGTYKVVWQVVSVDTHHTSGDFSFTVH